MADTKKAILIILDGWGIGNGSKSDVIAHENPAYFQYLNKTYPHAHLMTCGEDVGLPDGQMGNSEVGHLNIGAGRVVYQDLVKINKEIRENTIASNPALVDAFEYARDNEKAVHFIGLISDGGVHSLDTHVYKLCDLTRNYNLPRVYVHAQTDGRDTDPKSGLGFITNLHNHLQNSNGQIASIVGRYYGMDRDKRWDRVKIAYDLLVSGIGKEATDPIAAMQESYNEEITDEFVKPIVMVDKNEMPIGKIEEGDVVICFNYRTDRLREMTMVLSQADMPEFGMKTLPLYYLTMTRYDETFKDIILIYDKDNVENTLGEVLEKAGKKQLRIAETEKFAHVTFFFSGGKGSEFEGEERILVQSPKVATYDLLPEMSAYQVKDAVVEQLKAQKFDFICLNFANGDMVGHTGIYEAIQKAIFAINECVEAVVETAKENGYSAVIIADHGNADYAVNDDGSANTAHSLNPVPIIVVDNDCKKVENGILADVAPTLLSIIKMPIPADMTGKVLTSF